MLVKCQYFDKEIYVTKTLPQIASLLPSQAVNLMKNLDNKFELPTDIIHFWTL